MNELFKSVRYLKGVGGKKAAYYESWEFLQFTIFFIIFRAVMLIFQIPYLLFEANINDYAVLKGTIVKNARTENT